LARGRQMQMAGECGVRCRRQLEASESDAEDLAPVWRLARIASDLPKVASRGVVGFRGTAGLRIFRPLCSILQAPSFHAGASRSEPCNGMSWNGGGMTSSIVSEGKKKLGDRPGESHVEQRGA
jgi:hypothetical protein